MDSRCENRKIFATVKNGNTPAGEMLEAVAKALPEDRHWQITVFIAEKIKRVLP